MPPTHESVVILLPVVVAVAVTFGTILIHSLALIVIVRLVRREERLGRAGASFWKDVAIVAGVALVALAAHLVEIAVWALVFSSCGRILRARWGGLSLGNELHDAGRCRRGHVTLVEITGSARSGGRDAHVRRLNRDLFAVIQRLLQTKFREISS